MFLRCYGFKASKTVNKPFNRYRSLITSPKNEEILRNDEKNPKARFNETGIQMINENLRQYLFGSKKQVNKENIEKAREHLKQFNLLDKNRDIINDDTNKIKFPKLVGSNLDEHFKKIANKYIDRYVNILSKLCNTDKIPDLPDKFNFSPGWTKYDSITKKFEKIDYPKDDALVFDVEILVSEGNVPTLAVALSDTSWYSWCSERLINESFKHSPHITIHDLIPFESKIGENKRNYSAERLLVCHNAGFDRSFVKEQYFLEKSKLHFVDTMSMHIACSGYTGEQRVIKNTLDANNKNDTPKITAVNIFQNKFLRAGELPNLKWISRGSFNSLYEVHKFYCPDSPRLEKELRNVFVNGNMNNIRDDFQSLMRYCANDVKATFDVVKKLFPIFMDRFSHPVTFCGMLEMSSMYLPINKNWLQYINNCERVYQDVQQVAKNSLIKSANEACEYIHNEKYKDDPWLFDLDWKVKECKIAKETKKKTNVEKTEVKKLNENPIYKILNERDKKIINENSIKLCSETENVIKTASRLPKRVNHLCNYPEWYRELHDKNEEIEGMFGENRVSVKTRITPKLLRLTWNEFPLYHSSKHGWGYLVPKLELDLTQIENETLKYPYEQLKKICNFEELKNKIINRPKPAKLIEIEHQLSDIENKIQKLSDNLGSQREIFALIKKKTFLHKKSENFKQSASLCPYHSGNGPFEDDTIPKGCYFFRIPHKDGNDNKVGNPLAKGFISKISEGTLRSYQGDYADLLAKCDASMHYWVNNEKRIRSQITVWLSDFDEESDETTLGAILPRTVVAGTITRRAVEPTWLTASNYKKDRIGSELKPMIQSPDGYCFVGADVDSQELWIASLIGDSYFASIHGSTAIGWMTLQGKKKDNTDMHSVTANMIGISRDQAKIFNYGRIYGAGRKFAEKLLLQFNPNLSEFEAEEKSKLMYDSTKGKKNTKNDCWVGGSESEMFNKLEKIAKSDSPKTPILGSSITKCLEPEVVSNDFITSRINWVVQSSAVDYLHLMLVCMKWLIDEYNIKARFSISIHDEVRYLVEKNDRYRAALALQLTNLYIRALFSYKLGLDDLPIQIAFFSEIDVDLCLRKDVNLEFVTPSNPFGLSKGYGVPVGETLDIYSVINKTGGDLENKIVVK